jgi:hypothetical protein
MDIKLDLWHIFLDLEYEMNKVDDVSNKLKDIKKLQFEVMQLHDCVDDINKDIKQIKRANIDIKLKYSAHRCLEDGYDRVRNIHVNIPTNLLCEYLNKLISIKNIQINALLTELQKNGINVVL